MLETTTTKAYVDDVHYNERTNEQIAARIADRLRSAGMTENGAGHPPK